MSAQEQLHTVTMTMDAFTGIIDDAYQAECERFDAELETAYGDVYAYRHKLRRAVATPMAQQLADKLFAAEEAAACIGNRRFFTAGLMAGLKIAALACHALASSGDDSGELR